MQVRGATHILQAVDCSENEMKLLVKDRVHPVGDIIYRCFSLAFTCNFYIVRKGWLEPWQIWLFGKCEPLLQPLIRINATHLCWIGASEWGIGYQKIITRSVSGREKPKRIWTKSSVDVPADCPLETGMRNADVDCGTMWASPHPLLASHSLRWNDSTS